MLVDNDIYKMWFSTRGIENYRAKEGNHYMIGYAESDDGLNWERKESGITTSESGWDSDMLEYASVKKYNDKYYMIYNGNAFGKTGFGYAVK